MYTGKYKAESKELIGAFSGITLSACIKSNPSLTSYAPLGIVMLPWFPCIKLRLEISADYKTFMTQRMIKNS